MRRATASAQRRDRTHERGRCTEYAAASTLQLADRVSIPSATCFNHPPATADDVAAIPEPAREAGKANAPTASLTGRQVARYHP
jgi:hypothetical protein